MATSPTSTALRAQFPSGPLLDPASGELMPAWRGYFAQLYTRTGGAEGSSTAVIEAALGVERTVRGTADAGLSNAIAAERTARELADSTEAATRLTADNTLLGLITSEQTARMAGDARMVPLTGAVTITGPVAFAGSPPLAIGSAAGPTWTTGTAAPSSTQPVGSLYSRVGGAVGATLYVSRGAGAWLPVAGV